jgi:uncharacterized protein YkwD
MKTWGTSLALLLLAVSLLGAAPAGAKKHRGSCANATTKPQALTRDQATGAIRCLINRRRKAHGIGTLAANGPLNGAAQIHTDFMVDHACFDHQCSGEADFAARIKATGYLDGATSWTVGENIAWGEQALGTPANIVTAWMNSPGHRANILNEDFDDIGIGFVTGSPFSAHEANAAIYTTDFGFSHG